MDRKNKKIPTHESEAEYICPSASWGDMTGIISAAAEETEQRGYCDEAYPYLHGYGGSE